MKYITYLLLALSFFTISGCATGPQVKTDAVTGEKRCFTQTTFTNNYLIASENLMFAYRTVGDGEFAMTTSSIQASMYGSPTMREHTSKYIKEVVMGWQGDLVSANTANEYQTLIRVPAVDYIPLLKRNEKVMVRLIDFKNEYKEFQADSAVILDLIRQTNEKCPDLVRFNVDDIK